MKSVAKRHKILVSRIWSRWCRQYGVNPIIGVIVIIGLLIGMVAILDFKTIYAPYILILGFAVGLWQLCGIERNNFLRSVEGEKSWRILRLVENLVLSIPLIVYLGIKSEWLLSAIVCGLSILLTFITKQVRNLARIKTPLSWIPLQFPYGVRVMLLGYIFIYALVVIAISVGNENLGLVSIGAIQLIPWLTIEKKEHPVLLWEHTITPASFMVLKAMRILKGYMLIGVIPIVAFLFFYPQFYLHIIGLVVTGVIGAFTLITIKYTYYGRQVPLLVYMVFVASCAVPPLLIIMGNSFYHRSIQNLKLYTNYG